MWGPSRLDFQLQSTSRHLGDFAKSVSRGDLHLCRRQCSSQYLSPLSCEDSAGKLATSTAMHRGSFVLLRWFEGQVRSLASFEDFQIQEVPEIKPSENGTSSSFSQFPLTVVFPSARLQPTKTAGELRSLPTAGAFRGGTFSNAGSRGSCLLLNGRLPSREISHESDVLVELCSYPMGDGNLDKITN